MTPIPKPVPDRKAPGVVSGILPASEVWSGDRRLESETYLTSGYGIRRQIETSRAPYARVGELARVWQPSRLKGIVVRKDHGVPFLAATQVFDIRPVPRKWLAPDRTSDVGERYLEKDWILVTCSGNVGDVIASYAPLLGIIVSHDLLRVQAHDPTQWGYLYCFLRSRFGRAMMRSSQYGSIIKHLEPEHLDAMPVPLSAAAQYRDLNGLIREVFALREEAFALTQEAERRFASEIGVIPASEAEETHYATSASEVFRGSRRFDGYHYNPVAAAVLAALRKTGRKIRLLAELTAGVDLPNRFKRGVPAQDGIPYVDSEDIFKINPEVTKFIPEVTRKNAAEYFVRAGWLLLARSGQLYGINGSVMLATTWHESKIISEHIIRIIPKTDGGVRAGYLQMALGHPTYGRPLVLRMAFGTSIPEIAPADVLRFPVIRLDETAENAIADAIERATQLRLIADQKENQAVERLEAEVGNLLTSGSAGARRLAGEGPRST